MRFFQGGKPGSPIIDVDRLILAGYFKDEGQPSVMVHMEDIQLKIGDFSSEEEARDYVDSLYEFLNND